MDFLTNRALFSGSAYCFHGFELSTVSFCNSLTTYARKSVDNSKDSGTLSFYLTNRGTTVYSTSQIRF